jgi:peptidoglycan/LPS O-acetylase OafA/YrhL
MTVADRLLAPFQRDPSSGRFIPEVDGLRCVAIAAVIAFHLAGFVAATTPGGFAPDAATDPVYRLARHGHVGVQLFFVISGFVVALPFADHRLAGGRPVDLRRFYLRRVTRIEPPYVIALCFWLLAFGLSGMGPGWPALRRSFPASLFYLHNAAFGRPSDVMPPAWSLEIEVQFYLLAPLLAGVFLIRRSTPRRALLVSATIALTVAQRWLRRPGEVNGLNLGQEGQHFLVGLLLADLYVTRWRTVPPRRPWLADAAAAAGAVLLLAGVSWASALPWLLMGLVGGALRGRLWRAALRNRWVYTFGGTCYTVYLYHGFFKALPGHLTTRLRIGPAFWPNFLLQAALLVPVIVIGSAGMFLLTERPFMRLGRQSKAEKPPQDGFSFPERPV